MKPGTLGIVGTGLIGGSVGEAARKRGWHVLGYDELPDATHEALAVGAVDAVCSRKELYERSDVVVIAAYADGTLAEIARLLEERPAKPHLILDVASVKTDIAREAASLERFVPAHPMAGTEHSGARHARADLFEGRAWAYCPTGNEPVEQLAVEFIVSLGAIPLRIDPVVHDRIVARTSHLPQIVATAYTALFHQANEDPSETEALSGATARELLRLGRASDAMWHSVFRANASTIVPDLRELAARLIEAADAIERSNEDEISIIFERARGQR